MKFNSLQFGKAKSAALFILLLSVVGMKNALAQIQDYPVATLQHNGYISAFYGSNAFVEANAAASNGDTITLSGGNFNGCTLSKALTIHGAGCVMDSVAGIAPTVIIGYSAYIDQRNDTLSLIIEGIRFNERLCNNWQTGVCNVDFVKCNFVEYYYNGGQVTNFHFEDCIIKSFHFAGKGATFTNCAMKLSYYNQTDRYNPNTITNSVVLLDNNVSLGNSLVMNSIIKTADNNSHTNSSFFNNIGIKKGNTSIFEDQYYSTNMEVNDFEDVFETFDGTVTFDNIYQLKQEIINTFPGNDGTQVGIYGGMKPYNTRLTYMIMKRCNVAGSTTIDNKLSVEVELRTDD